MGILDRFHGHHESEGGIPPVTAFEPAAGEAMRQYRVLLRAAPPETIEQAHASAFAQLSPAQRQTILAELGHEMPAFEWETGARYAAEPHSLARMATRAEMERPGTLERLLPRLDLPASDGGGGLVGMLVGSWAACQFFAQVGQRAADDRDGVDAILGCDALIGEQTMDSDEAWRR